MNDIDDDYFKDEPDIPSGCVEIGAGDDEEIDWNDSKAGRLMERLQDAVQKLIWELEVDDAAILRIMNTDEWRRVFGQPARIELRSLYGSSLALVDAIPGIGYDSSFWEKSCISGVYKWYYVDQTAFDAHGDDIKKLIEMFEQAAADYVDPNEVQGEGRKVFQYEYLGSGHSEEVFEYQGCYFRMHDAEALEGPFETLEEALEGCAFRPATPPSFVLNCDSSSVERLTQRMLVEANVPLEAEVEINGELWLVGEGRRLKKVENE
jgi:hypothetical protein